MSQLTCPRIVFSFKLPHLKTNRSEQCPAFASTFKTFQNGANRHFYQTPLRPQWGACSGFDQKLRGCNHQNGGIFSSRWSLDWFLGKTAGHVHGFTTKLMRFHVLPPNKPLIGMEKMYQSLAFPYFPLYFQYFPIFSPSTHMFPYIFPCHPYLKPPRWAELQHIGLRQAQWHGLQALVLEAIEEVSLQWLAPARWPQL